MPQLLVDLLWRDHPLAPQRGARGPRARHSTSEVVDRAIGLADESGLDALTIRALSGALGSSAMSVYTHINSRDDLLVLMVDRVHARMALPAYGDGGWRARVEVMARANRDLYRTRPWLLAVADPRVALGPGTIAKYDHELHAFDDTGLGPLDRDAAVTFVLDFVRASALPGPGAAPEAFDDVWEQSSPRLGTYLGDDHQLAQEVGRAAGESMGAPYDAQQAWEFGLERMLAGLAQLFEP